MSICLITGNHPRHKFFARNLIDAGVVSGWVIEQREVFVPEPDKNYPKILTDLFIHHFSERERVETEEFTCDEIEKNISKLEINISDLNSKKTIAFVKTIQPKILLSYGCHKISQNFINDVGCIFWNCHGGLSPEYRGVITHFWPSYFLEPQMTGITLHTTTNYLDGGDIIFQTAAPMVKGDTLHKLAARNVKHFTSELSKKLLSIDFNNLPEGVQQQSYGKVFMAKDWRPEHLKLIYIDHNDSIVDKVIDGEISGRLPILIDNFF